MERRDLQRYSMMLEDIIELLGERDGLSYSSVSSGRAKGRVGKGRHSDNTSAAIERQMEITEEIKVLLADLAILRTNIEYGIAHLLPEEQEVLRLRYIKGMAWPNIVKAMRGDRENYEQRKDSYMRTISNIHGRALLKMEK